MGKHTLDLNLHNPHDRQTFDSLLSTTDVLLDGYRPGALARLGHGPAHLTALAQSHNKGVVYISESCFGAPPPAPSPPTSPTPPTSPATLTSQTAPSTSDWTHRPGWQQTADCVTGVAWAQGIALSEPIIPPFSMSDHGTRLRGRHRRPDLPLHLRHTRRQPLGRRLPSRLRRVRALARAVPGRGAGGVFGGGGSRACGIGMVWMR